MQMIPFKLNEEISRWIKEGKYGHLQINFAGGKILNVNRVESIKVDMLITGTSNGININCTASKALDIE